VIETRYCARCERQTVGDHGRCYECGSASWLAGRKVTYRERRPGGGMKQLDGQTDLLDAIAEAGDPS
jgi:hypothetical protein